jgi:hypothetical protein
MGSPHSLGGGDPPASPPPGSRATPPYVPPAAAWRPSTLVRRLPVKIRRPSSLPGWLFFLIVLAAIVAGAWYYQVLDLVNPNSPRATAKAFMRSIYEGDNDRTRELCTAETQQLLAPLAQQARPGQTTAKTGPPRELSWRATAVEVTGDRARVTIDQTLKQGQSVRSLKLPLALAKENGKWRVDLTGGLEPLMGLSGLSGSGVAPGTPWLRSTP